MEMFEAFGFADRVMKEAYWVNEFSFWKPDESHRGALVRGNRIQDVEEGLSEFPHVVLNQARVHDFYLDVMHNSPSRLTPYYARRLLDLAIPSGAGRRMRLGNSTCLSRDGRVASPCRYRGRASRSVSIRR